jgi:hypothetical protein
VREAGGERGQSAAEDLDAPARRAYVRDQLSLIMGRPVDPSVEDGELFWRAFSCAGERTAPRDGHGNVEPRSAGPSGRTAWLNDRLGALGEIGEPRWPHGRRFAAVLTHDVDRIVRHPWRERMRQAVTRGTGEPLAARVRLTAAAFALRLQAARAAPEELAPFDRYLRDEERLGFHSTFLVLPDNLLAPSRHDHWYRYPDRVRYEGHSTTFVRAARGVLERGADIGVHGSYASAYDAEILAHDRSRIEDMLGSPVVSTRQHYLRFDADVTPRLQEAVGFRVDSTLGWSSTIGARNGLAMPFFWPATDLLEAPLIIQDVGLARDARDRSAAVSDAAALIERVAETGGAVTLSWHTHPSGDGYESYSSLLSTVSELGGWGCSLAELDTWWRARRARLEHSAAEGQAPV